MFTAEELSEICDPKSEKKEKEKSFSRSYSSGSGRKSTPRAPLATPEEHARRIRDQRRKDFLPIIKKVEKEIGKKLSESAQLLNLIEEKVADSVYKRELKEWEHRKDEFADAAKPKRNVERILVQIVGGKVSIQFGTFAQDI
jgi:flagellar motility protein MotE (MotC chaperone)